MKEIKQKNRKYRQSYVEWPYFSDIGSNQEATGLLQIDMCYEWMPNLVFCNISKW